METPVTWEFEVDQHITSSGNEIALKMFNGTHKNKTNTQTKTMGQGLLGILYRTNFASLVNILGNWENFPALYLWTLRIINFMM